MVGHSGSCLLKKLGMTCGKPKSIFYKWYWDLIIISTNDIFFLSRLPLKNRGGATTFASVDWHPLAGSINLKKKTITMWCCLCQNQALSPSLGLFKLLYLYHMLLEDQTGLTGVPIRKHKHLILKFTFIHHKADNKPQF